MGRYIITYDIGTTSTKTCLYSFENKLELVNSSSAEYSLVIKPGGVAEQNPQDWLDAMAKSTKKVLKKSGIEPHEISGIAFCSQMQGLVLVDKQGQPIRPAMSYMDNRAERQKEHFMNRGPKVFDLRVDAIIRGLRINGAVPASVKDPIWKYLWVKENAPEDFKNIDYWFDVKDYLVFALTGRAIMTPDSAFATFLYDTRRGKNRWDKGLVQKYGVDPSHLPKVIHATDIAGETQKSIADFLGLRAGIPVFGSGGDATLIALGSGAVNPGDTHVYTGTSGWVSTVVTHRKIDINAMIASIPATQDGVYNYFAEQETAGKCLEWVKDHLALDEINLFLSQSTVMDDPQSIHDSLYDYLVEVISRRDPGSGGVLFTPWLHGNRSPFEDPAARGIFFNLSLDTGKADMIRAVLEGIIFNQFWLLESIEKSVDTNAVIRFVGGGAQNRFISQMLADITNRVVEVPDHPQYVGAAGAAIVAALGLNWLKSYSEITTSLSIKDRVVPNSGLHKVYGAHYRVFKKLYHSNRKLFHMLNRES